MRQEGTDWTDLLTKMFDVITSRLIHTNKEHEYINPYPANVENMVSS